MKARDFAREYWAILRQEGLDRCFRCNKRKARWLTARGRLCGICRNMYVREESKRSRSKTREDRSS